MILRLEWYKSDCQVRKCDWQIKELEKFKVNHNHTNNVKSGLNVEKEKIKISIPMFMSTDQEWPVKFLNDLDRYIHLWELIQ